jgi:hypothetical protein
MYGAMPVTEPIKNISAIKKRPSGYQQRRKRRGGENVIWKRITETFDRDLKRFGANPAIAAPLTRLVLFNHLTVSQGKAGRRYAEVVRDFEKYFVVGAKRTARSASLEPVRGAEDQEVQRHIVRGTIKDYEEKAKKAKRKYQRVMRALDQFKDPITGRNYAKDQLDNLCLADQEPLSEYRNSIAMVLTVLAKVFDKEGR